MKHTEKERVIALAGVFQAAHLVHQVGQIGSHINDAIESSIHSLFVTETEDAADIYNGSAGVITGLGTLFSQLGGDGGSTRQADVTRYALSLLALERKLSSQPAMLAMISEGIELAGSQVEYFGSETHENVVGRLADIYQQTISNLKPRIMVKGDAALLQRPENANLIRALLLAGIRSAVMWHQCGGSRWHFIFRRKKILAICRQLLSEHLDHSHQA
jgi:high frequency lysogenization protein